MVGWLETSTFEMLIGMLPKTRLEQKGAHACPMKLSCSYACVTWPSFDDHVSKMHYTLIGAPTRVRLQYHSWGEQHKRDEDLQLDNRFMITTGLVEASCR